MYFKSMSNFVYPLDSIGEQVLTKDIFKRVVFNRMPTGQLNFEYHYIENGDTPDILAYKYYKNTSYHWLILLANDITNPYEEWPKDDSSLSDYVEGKYGVGNANATHHYILTGSDPEIIVDYTEEGISDGTISTVSNFDYEANENEAKKQIKILKARYVKEMLAQYKRLLGNR